MNRAFTLIEIMVVATIIVLVICAFYSLFTGGIRTANVGDWKSRAQIKMRVATKKLHMDISAATYPSNITLQKTVVESDKKWNLKYKSGKTMLKDQSNINLLEFYICTPGKNTPIENIQRKIIKASLSVEKKESKTVLVYQKELIEGNKEPGDSGREELVEDVAFFDASVINPVADPIIKTEEFVLKVEIGAEHPQYSQTGISEIIDIPLHVNAVAM